MLEIIEVDPQNPQHVRWFLHLPFALYRDHPYWVPPLLSEARAILDPAHHPFYQHSDASFFLALEGKKCKGRLGVMENRNYNRHLGRKEAFWGYFECVPEQRVAQALFAAAFDWARKRGLEAISGPRDLLGANASGILVEGFDRLPALGVPYNPPYYQELILAAGFEKERDHLSGYLPGDYVLPERFYRIADRVRRRGKLRVKRFQPRERLSEWVPRVAQAYMTAFAENEGFYPLTEAEVALFARTILSVVDRRLIKLVIAGDDVVGFLLAYRNIGCGLRHARGRLLPLGWYHLWRAHRTSRLLDINGLGVLPEYWGRGANVLLYTELAETVRAFGFESADIVFVGEDNVASRSDMEAIGVTWHKRHRSYSRRL